MASVFSQILNMSLTGCLVIAAVILVRFCIKRLPKIFSYILWSVVLFRLLCPVSISGPGSLLSILKPTIQETTQSVSAVSYLPVPEKIPPAFVYVAAEDRSQNLSAEPITRESVIQNISAWLWIIGATSMGAYGFIQYLMLRRRLIGAVKYRGRIYLADGMDTAFVMGLLKPKIYIPSHIPAKERKYILAHERHHIRRGDHVIKLLAYFALCLHWFNPMAWIAFILSGRDMEMSCDEAVIRQFGSSIRAEYSESLLRLSANRYPVPGMPLAFGEGDTRGRILNMAKWKKPRRITSILCVIVCIAILAACGMNPSAENHSAEKEAATPWTPFTDESVNILVTCYTDENGTGSPETTVLLSVHPQLHAASTATVLKDTFVSLPDYQGHVTGNNKFSVCYTLGKAWGGLDGAVEMVNQCIYDNFGITIDHNIEITGAGSEKFMDILNVLFAKQKVMLNRDSEAIFQELLTLIAGSAEPARLNEAKKALSEARLDSCTIPAEGTYTAEERNIGGEMTYVLVMNPPDVSQSSVVATEITVGSGAVRYGALEMQLADGYSCYAQDGEVILTKDGTDVGGIRSYRTPAVPFDYSIEYLRAMGLPEAQETNEPIAYMIGNSVYGEIEGSFFHELTPESLNVHHHFFLDHDLIYDVYYDQNILQSYQAETFLKTIRLNGESIAPSKPEEDDSVRLCRHTLESIRSGAYQISVDRKNEGSYGLNRSSATVYTASGDNWISITHVPDDDSYHGYMNRENNRYSNEASGWEEDGTVRWAPDLYPDSVYVPWLISFQWEDSLVSYVDTIVENGIKTVMLRVNEPFPGYEELSVCYYVNVNFTEDGQFLNVKIETDFLWENDISIVTIQEAVITLEEAKISAYMQSQYENVSGS